MLLRKELQKLKPSGFDRFARTSSAAACGCCVKTLLRRASSLPSKGRLGGVYLIITRVAPSSKREKSASCTSI